MSHGKYGLRAFGLVIVAALGLMAFMAAGAQANWLYLEAGKAVELTVAEPVKVAVHEKSEGNLLLSNGIEIRCAVIEGQKLELLPGSPTTATATGSVSFSTCHTFNKGTAASACDPTNQPIIAGGTAKVILHSDKKNYVLFSPLTGQPFTTILFGAKCALVESSEVTGNLVAECGHLVTGAFTQEDCATHAVSHLLRQAPAALFPSDKLQFGELGATLDGIAAVELSGTHKGASWSGEV